MADYFVTGSLNSFGQVGGSSGNGIITFGNQGGNDRQGAARFTSVAIAQGAVIPSAIMHFYVDSVGSAFTTLKGVVFGLDEDNTADFGGSPMSRPSTSAQTSVNITLPSVGTFFDVDITAIVNEIFARGGWSSGNALGIKFFNQGSDTDVYWRDPGVTSYLTITSPSSASVSPSTSSSVSPSVSMSISPSRSFSPSASQSISSSRSLSPSASQSPSPSASISPSGSTSRSPSLSLSPSGSISPSGSLSPSRSLSASPSASRSLSPSGSFSPSASKSASLSPSGSQSPSASDSASVSPVDNILSVDFVEICFTTDYADEYIVQNTNYPQNEYIGQGTRYDENQYTPQNTIFKDEYDVCD